MTLIEIFLYLAIISNYGCKTPTDSSSELEDTNRAGANMFALIGCNSEAGWISKERGSCKRPYRMCYVGPRKNVIAKIKAKSLNIEEEFGLKNAKNGEDVAVIAEIWDLPNNVKTKKISIGSCKQEIRTAVIASMRSTHEPSDDARALTGISCKYDNAKWYPIEDASDVCSENLKLCYAGSQSKIFKTLNNGVTVFDEFELRNPKSISSSEIRADVWDMPNETVSQSVQIKTCAEPISDDGQQSKVLKMVLQNIDNLCRDTICAGDFTCDFKGLNCDFSKSQCEMKI